MRDPGMTTIASLRGSGVFRVNRLHEGFVDMDEFRQTDYYRANYLNLGIHDELSVACPISPETEAYFVFNRRETEGRFSDADAELAGFALRGLSRFHRQMFFSHGLLVAQEPLTPTQVVALRSVDL